MPMMAAISMMVVLPNHIKKFINPISERVPKAVPIKSMGVLVSPIDMRMELMGPLVENSAKNSMANAEAIIRLGR